MMSSIVCASCSKVIETGGSALRQCPYCGETLDNAADQTGKGIASAPFAETLIEPVEERRHTVGRYVLEKELGRGGFGTVFLARDPELNRLVAIKVPRSFFTDSRQHFERFAREARSAAQLHHPGIVSVHTVERDGDVAFIVCEYIDGESLHARIRRGALSFLEAASLVTSVARAVDYAHSRKVVHRDIKPSNILIGTDGKPRLADFGLAKQFDVNDPLTADDQVLGTPAFMSPEQASGKQKHIDHRTDVYSLGMVLYQLLTGQLPFQGDPRVVRHQVLDSDPPAPRSLNRNIPLDLETVCQKAIEKEPGKRYQSAGDLAADLERWQRGEPIVARHIGAAERGWRWCRRNPLTAGLLSSVALLLLVTTATSLAMYSAEANALQAEASLRRQIEETLQKDRELLSRAYVEKGNRYLGTGGSGVEYNPLKALPWLQAALEIDETNPKRRDAARIRVQSQLTFAPHVEQLWVEPGGIATMGVAPAGNLFAVAGNDRVVKLWKTSASEPVAPPLVHGAAVTAMAFSPDGALLATGSNDGLRLWEVASGKLKAGPERPASKNRVAAASLAFRSIQFSESGKWLVSVIGATAQVWDASSAAPAGPPVVVPGDLFTAEFADSEKLLVTSSGDGSIRVFAIGSSEELPPVASGGEGFALSAVAPDGTMAAGFAEKKVFLWNCSSRKQQGNALAHDAASVADLSFSDDGRLLAMTSNDGLVRMWQVSGSRPLWKKQFFAGQSSHVEFAPRQPLLAVIDRFKRIVVVHAETGQLVAQPISAEVRLNSVGWMDTGGLLAATDDGAIRLWKLESSEPVFLLPERMKVELAVASEDRRLIAAVDDEGVVCLLRAGADGRFDSTGAATFPVDGSVSALALTRDGSKLALATSSRGTGSAILIDSRTQESLVSALPNEGTILAMKFSPDGRLLVCMTIKQLVSVWDLASGTRLYEPIKVDGHPLGLDIDNTGTHCAVAADKQVVVFELATGKRAGPALFHDKNSTMMSVRFLKDKNRLVTGCMDGKARLWDVKDSRLLGETGKHPKMITCLDVALDGSAFLAGSASGSARLWSSQDAAPASPLFDHPQVDAEHRNEIVNGIVAPNGRWVATLSGRTIHQVAAQLHAWDALSGEMLFVRSLEHLQSRFPPSGQGDPGGPLRVVLMLFSPDSRLLHVVTTSGLFVTVDLIPNSDPMEALQPEITIRSGIQFDGFGGLKILDASELDELWRNEQSRSR